MAARGGCVVVGRGNCEKVPLGFFFLSFITRLVLVIWLVGDSGRFKTGRRNLGHVARGGGARSSTIHAACGYGWEKTRNPKSESEKTETEPEQPESEKPEP